MQRDALQPSPPPPGASPIATASAVRFASDGSGRIAWTGAGLAPMLVGLRLGERGAAAAARSDEGLTAAVAGRQPVVEGRLTIDGAAVVAGEWRVSAVPWFDPLDGSFDGYRGVLRRPAEGEPEPLDDGDDGCDRLRQALHELRTPVNAILGFAELIREQLFGPVPDRCRRLADRIAADAGLVVAALAVLERQSSGGEPRPSETEARLPNRRDAG